MMMFGREQRNATQNQAQDDLDSLQSLPAM